MLKVISLQVLGILFVGAFHCQACVRHTFVVEETPYTRLCRTKNILTVNGLFPGPTLHVHKGDTIIVDVHNKGNYNITIHWHGVKQPGNLWSNGLEYITQCPIQPGGRFKQKIIFSTEEGTLWWHAHKTFKIKVDDGKTYVLRLINAAVQEIHFFAIAKHNLAVVGTDGSYTKHLKTSYVAISPGQTIDVLLKANEKPDHYYMAARVYSGAPYENHPIEVPTNITTKMFFTISVNTFPCPNNSCEGPNGIRLATSINNISFVNPSIDILQAYYYHINGVFRTRFPDFPPLIFNFTAEYLPLYLETPKRGTKVKILDYNTAVEIVFQGTNLVGGNDDPMHLHGFSFFVVGLGLGNFDKGKDPLEYNLVDPPLQNTIAVPLNGWTTIRFKACNPGVWSMHCHFDRHMTWGMDMAFVVKNGKGPEAHIIPPPPDMPPRVLKLLPTSRHLIINYN
ncbi:hypothetical protein FH972_015875 [Carpinus fangiana]|uniref:Laccase n=1 Tax=Carpinus fangiana TaxID=176857 RepID=A0A5N6RE59_9ROSI|nr:hypothetical protein FH972_015875 [Carpinus fangiana]